MVESVIAIAQRNNKNAPQPLSDDGAFHITPTVDILKDITQQLRFPW
jgi:hypothetical protein